MSDPFRIKVCGITTEAAAQAAAEAGADHLGVILCRSVRRVTPGRAAALARAVPSAWVGVFADAALGETIETATAVGLAAIQLHGRESPELCRAVREATGLPVWKAIGAGLGAEAARYEGAVDALLLDAGRGGSGRTLDWDAFAAAFPRTGRRVPLLLAGGLGPDNVGEAIRTADPDGVDASSRLERAPGVKDPELVRAFVASAREAALDAASSDAPGARP